MRAPPSLKTERIITPGTQTGVQPRVSRGRKIGLALLSLYPLALLGLSAVQWLAPQRVGPLALSQVLAPYLFLPLLVLLPFLLLRGAGVLRGLLLLCALVYGLRFMPHFTLAASSADPAALSITAMSWNVYFWNGQSAGVQEFLHSKPADIVALHEVTGGWIADDEVLHQQYPYQLTYPDACTPGIALLSAYPILDHNAFVMNRHNDLVLPMCWARLDLGNGQTMVFMGAHPQSPDNAPRACVRGNPLCYQTADRDEQIVTIRQAVDGFLQAGEPLLFVGDFNTTEREPAYGNLVAGLQDTYRTVGSGNGSTWSPLRLVGLGIPLLRIDYLMASPNSTPLSMTTDCTFRGSDHCLVLGQFEIK